MELSLMLIVLFQVAVKGTISAQFKRQSGADVYYLDRSQCEFSSSFQNSNGNGMEDKKCQCNQDTPHFTGKGCENVIDRACGTPDGNDKLPNNVETISEIQVFDYERKKGIWKNDYSQAIVEALKLKRNDIRRELKRLLQGYLLKVTWNGEAERCVVFKFYGTAKFPLPERDFNKLVQATEKIPTTTMTTATATSTTTTTTVLASAVHNKPNGFPTTTAILIGTVAVLTLVMLVILFIFLARQRKQNRRNIERALQPPEYSVPVDENIYSSASLPRYSGACSSRCSDVSSIPSYTERAHGFSDSGFATYAGIGPATEHNELEPDYSTLPYSVPHLEHVYKVLELGYDNQVIDPEYATPDQEPEYKVLEAEMFSANNTEKNNNATKTATPEPKLPNRSLQLNVPTLNRHVNHLYDVTADSGSSLEQPNLDAIYAKVDKSA